MVVWSCGAGPVTHAHIDKDGGRLLGNNDEGRSAWRVGNRFTGPRFESPRLRRHRLGTCIRGIKLEGQAY